MRSALRRCDRRSVARAARNSGGGVGPGSRFCEREERVVLRKSEFERGKVFILNEKKICTFNDGSGRTVVDSLTFNDGSF